MRALAFALLLPGCASMQQPNMNVDQLRAVAADKSTAVVCAVVQTPAGTGKLIIIARDLSPKDTGAIAVDPNCNVVLNGPVAASVRIQP